MKKNLGTSVINSQIILVYIYLSTRTAHGSAEEQIDDEHNKEENTKDNAKVEQPHGHGATILTRFHFWKLNRVIRFITLDGQKKNIPNNVKIILQLYPKKFNFLKLTNSMDAKWNK